jgi:uncharacterized membrane protein
MSSSRSRRMLISSLASALALPALALAQNAPDAGADNVHCYGVNKCKETGDCGGPGHGCANQNTCKRQGYIDMNKDTCLRLDGGRLTPNEEKKPAAGKKDGAR